MRVPPTLGCLLLSLRLAPFLCLPDFPLSLPTVARISQVRLIYPLTQAPFPTTESDPHCACVPQACVQL